MWVSKHRDLRKILPGYLIYLSLCFWTLLKLLKNFNRIFSSNVLIWHYGYNRSRLTLKILHIKPQLTFFCKPHCCNLWSACEKVAVSQQILPVDISRKSMTESVAYTCVRHLLSQPWATQSINFSLPQFHPHELSQIDLTR